MSRPFGSSRPNFAQNLRMSKGSHCSHCKITVTMNSMKLAISNLILSSILDPGCLLKLILKKFKL